MSNIIETKEVGGLTVNVVSDECSYDLNPRTERDNLGTFFGFHHRYVSPDTPPDSDPERAREIAMQRDNIHLPVFLYDHSGTCYRANASNPFHCPWDSGLFGFIYCSRADARKVLGVKRLTAKAIRKVLEILQSEVETYSAWANGEVYGWEVVDADGTQLDSCWGYIGEADYAMECGVEAAKSFDGDGAIRADFKALVEGRA